MMSPRIYDDLVLIMINDQINQANHKRNDQGKIFHLKVLSYCDSKQDKIPSWDYKSIYMSLVNLMVSIQKSKNPLKTLKFN